MIAGSSWRRADSGGEAPTWSPALTMKVYPGKSRWASFKYAASTGALPTGRPCTVVPGPYARESR